VAFETAAASQAEALGFSPAVHFVPHPIQNRTAAELEAIADDVVEAVVAAIGSLPSSRDDQ
jgi:hypothetical protein